MAHNTLNDDRIETLFFKARELPPSARHEYLDRECNSDEELRSSVDALLQAEANNDGLLDQPVEIFETTDGPCKYAEGTVIGRYKLLQKLGEGGFGEVYLAEQIQPVSRKVALKIIKPGMDSRAVIARFEVERQALAMMDHPNIARVLDGGTTEQGRPFFVMELVRGVSITEFCNKRRLNFKDRLELFMDVCHAVQHAHQKGIIHRDLKPSNVMITLHDGKPVVKVIDFGVARAIHQKLTEKTLFTRFGQMIGTPQYMSPEQAEMNGLDVDTRSDIFSLGVLLYELLTGAPPLTEEQFGEAGYAEIRHLICDQEYDRPSIRIGVTTEQQLLDAALQRSVSPEDLRKQIRGDLDWIVMRSLEKERHRRYSTASDLASDIRRFLDDQPVDARPPSMSYRFRKYVRRNRLFVASIAAIATILVVATFVSSGFAAWALVEKQIADEKAKVLTIERDEKDGLIVEKERMRVAAVQRNEQLEKQLYYAHIGQASSAIREYNLISARKNLDACPKDHRDWEWSRLHALVTPDHSRVRELPGQENAQFTTDGRRIFTSAVDDNGATLSVWNADTLNLIKEYRVGDERAYFALHPEGQYIAINGSIAFSMVKLDSGEVVWTKDSVSHSYKGRLAFSADGKSLAVQMKNNSIGIFDADSGDLLILKENQASVEGLVFGDDKLATCSHEFDNGPLRIWARNSLDLIREFDHFGAGIYSASFSPDGRRLACGGKLGRVTIQDLETGVIEQLLGPHDQKIFTVEFSPDGKTLATGSVGVVMLWDVESGRLKQKLLNDFSHVYSLSFSSDQKRLVASGRRQGKPYGSIVFDVSLAHDLAFDGDFSLGFDKQWPWCAARFSPDGSQLAIANASGFVDIWDAKLTNMKMRLHGQTTGVFSVAWSPDGRTVFSRDRFGETRAWNLSRRAATWVVTPTLRGSTELRFGLDVITVSKDGNQLLLPCGQDIVVLSTEDGSEVSRIKGDGEGFYVARYSNDRQLIAASRNQGQNHELIDIWDARDLRHIRQLRRRTSRLSGIRQVVFSPDDRLMASTSWDRTTCLWNVESGELVHQFEGHLQGVWGCQFSASGKRLFSCDGSGLFIEWDVDRGTEIFRLSEHRCGSFDINPVDSSIAMVGMAVQLIGTYPLNAELAQRRSVLKAAEQAIQRATHITPWAEEKIKHIRNDATISENVREMAEQWLTTMADDPAELFMNSWKLLLQRDGKEEFEAALKYANRAREIVPTNGEYTAAVGLAQYRLGDFKLADRMLFEALSTCPNYTFDNLSHSVDLKAGIYAVLSMSRFQQRDLPAAKQNLAEAKARLRITPEHLSTLKLHHLVREAEELINGKVPEN